MSELRFGLTPRFSGLLVSCKKRLAFFVAK